MLSVSAPVVLTNTSHGVNVSWNIQANLSESARVLGSNYTCPTTTTSYPYFSGGAWYFYNVTKSDCLVYADVNMMVFAVLENLSSASFLYPWNYLLVDEGASSENASYRVSPWNPALYNSSYQFNTTLNWSTGLSPNGSYAPTIHIYGGYRSFASNYSYRVVTWVVVNEASWVYGPWGVGGSASTRARLAGTSGFADLTAVTVW